jgi:methyl coenzyme M reductase subunit C-like uncharacterized protein (methanogenesis marker protein 7)
MEATIPAQTEQAKEWTSKFKEASGHALMILKDAIKKLQKEDDMLIYPFFKMRDEIDKKDYAAIADIAEPFVMSALRDGLPAEDLEKYFFAYLRNSEKFEVVIGARLKTDKDRAEMKKMKEDEDAKAAIPAEPANEILERQTAE